MDFLEGDKLARLAVATFKDLYERACEMVLRGCTV